MSHEITQDVLRSGRGNSLNLRNLLTSVSQNFIICKIEVVLPYGTVLSTKSEITIIR